MTAVVFPASSRESDWHARAVCRGCGWHMLAPFADLFHLFITNCAECGAEKPDCMSWRSRSRAWDLWDMRTMRWVSAVKIWNPSTWGTGRWETKGAV